MASSKLSGFVENMGIIILIKILAQYLVGIIWLIIRKDNMSLGHLHDVQTVMASTVNYYGNIN